MIDLASYINGFPFKPSDWSETGLPIVRIAQITGSSTEFDYFRGSINHLYKLENGDIVFSWSGTLCVVRWRGGQAWLNQHLFRVIPSPNIDNDFFFHLLSHAVENMEKSAHGSTMKHIKRGELKKYNVATPVWLEEQQKIAQILDTLDIQIQKTEALIAKLEKIKEGLLHDLLSRGIDQNGQLRPTPEQAPELYKESALGLIPRGWQCESLSSLSTGISYGFTNPMPTTSEGPWMITAADVNHGQINYARARRTRRFDYTKLSSKSKPNLGDILVTKDGTLGRIAVVDKEDLCINQSVASFRPRDAKMTKYLSLYLSAPLGQTMMLADAGGSTIKHLYVSKLSNLAVPVPPPEESEKVAWALSIHEERVESERGSLSNLKLLKEGLMDDLLTGHVRVTPLLKDAV